MIDSPDAQSSSEGFLFMSRLRTLAVALALALSAVTLPAPLVAGSAAAGVSDNKIRVVQHNTDMGGPGSALAEASRLG